MKVVYRCDYCGHQGIEEEVREHEKTCIKNPNLRGCYTCLHKKGLGFSEMECKNGVEIPKGKYMSQCAKWEKEEVSYDPDSPFAKMLHNMWGI